MVSVVKGPNLKRTPLLALLVLSLVLVPPPPAAADGHAAMQEFETVAPEARAAGFGSSVAWHGDTLVGAAAYSDVVQVVGLRDGVWTVLQTLQGESGSDFGADLAVHGDTLVVGAPDENAPGSGDGSVYVYRHNGRSWGLVERVEAPADAVEFGSRVDVHGDWFAVADLGYGYVYSGSDGTGVFEERTVYLFKVGAQGTALKQTLEESDLFQQRLFGYDLDFDGDRLVVGAPGYITDDYVNAGAVYVYARSGNTWNREATLDNGALADGGGFGVAVALTGNHLAVCDNASVYVASSNEDDRALYVYERGGSGWSRSQSVADVSCYAAEAAPGRLATSGFDNPDLRVWGREGSRWSDTVYTSDADTSRMALSPDGDRLALGYGSYASSYVTLVGPNQAPEAAVAQVPPPADMDGDGFETVVLDGSGSSDDAPGLRHYWYHDTKTGTNKLLGEGATLPVDLPVGLHDLYLVVADRDLGTDVAPLTVEVRPPPPPTPGFSWLPKDAASLEPIRFVDESTSEYGHIVAWHWDFDGDGEADATGPTPVWTFETPGIHPVTLTVETDVNTEEAHTQGVRVRNLAPEADAGMDEILEDEDGDGRVRVQLDGTGSDDADGEVRSYAWARDGRTVSRNAQTTLNLGPGVHDLDLTVTDDRGAKDTDRVTFLILEQGRGAGNGTAAPAGPGPTAHYTFAPQPGPPARAVQFTDRSSDPDGRVVMWWYDVGDDGTWDYTEPDPLVGLDAYGAHDVRLRVTDDDGNQNDHVENVFLRNLEPTAVIDARATEAFVGQRVVFVDNSTDPEGGIAERAWDFGDGGTSTEQAPSHVYREAGTYTVTLSITDEGGKTDAATLTVTVQDVPAGATVPAVAGSPHTPQADDSPFAPGDDALVDTDGDGEGDTPIEAVLEEDTGARTDDADAEGPFGLHGSGDDDAPSAAALLHPGKPWLWLLVGLGLVVLVASVWMVSRR